MQSFGSGLGPHKSYTHTEEVVPASFKIYCLAQISNVLEVQLYLRSVTPPRHQLLRLHEYNYIVLRDYSSPGRTGSTSTLPCAATTRHPAARALRQPCRAPRVLVSRPQRLYIDYAVRRRDVVFWAYDYLDYLPRLVSTRKLVEDGSRNINN
jgi:hypothetical protein